MPPILRTAARCALLSVALAVVVPAMAAAQSGSAGGSIGNDSQSLSGTRKARTVEPEDRGESRARPREPRRPARRESGGGGSIEGAWAVASVGRPCGAGTEAIVISSGRIIGQFTNGHVSPSGQATGAGASNGVSWTSTGRFSGRQGSGSFRRSDGCVGSWTATKQ